MRLTKAKQKQLDEAYDTLIQVCLYDRPLKDMEPFLADDVMNFGAGRKELTKTKTAFLRQIKNQKKLAAGLKMDFQFKPVLRKIINKGDGAIYTDDIVNTVWVSGVKNKLKFRLSFIFEYRDRKWIMVHSHTSTPDSQRSDDEVWPVEELKKRTEVLEKSLDEKIAELEVKNRELEIEAALEKVRSRSLAMHNSDELQDVINCVFDRLNELSIVTDTASILITHDNSKDYDSWIQNSDRSYSSKVLIPNAANTISLDTQAARESVKDFSKIYNKKEKDDFFDNLFKNSDLKNLPDHRKKLIAEAEYYSVCCVNAKNAGIFFARYNDKQFSEKERETLKRFVRVFEQSYIRFIDLQKAEAQAREAQIEAALEKVRSRSLAMHNANELGEVVTVIVEKLKDLGVVLDANGVVLCTYFQNSKDVMHWIVSTDYSMAGSYLLPYFDHPIFNAAWQSKENGDEYFSRAFSVAEKNSFFEHAFEHSDYRHFPDEFKQWIFQNDQHILSFAWQKNSAILIPSHTGVLPSEEDIAILKRFAKVFEQSYVRFLDLQKAEAQAREAQIQLALERVRARTMAMHHSDELTDVVKLLYQEFDKLKISNESTDIEIGLIDEKTGIASVWAHLYLSDGTISTFKFPVTHFDEVRKEFEEWKATPLKKRNELFFTMDLSRERWQDFVDIAVQLPELSEIFKPLIEAKITKWVTHNAYFSHGFLTLQGTEAYSPQTQEIQKRFAKVFEQTYTRFLDLQKAEAQAKEAQIELGLERVRARAMAMQSSDELKELIGTVFIELTKLDIVLTRCVIMIYDTVSNDSVWWLANSEAQYRSILLTLQVFAWP